MPFPKIKPHQVAAVIAEYEAGATITALGEKYECHGNTIVNTVRKHGGRVRTDAESRAMASMTRRNFTPAEDAKVAAEYASGKSRRDLAKQFGVGEEAITQALARSGTAMRPIREALNLALTRNPDQAVRYLNGQKLFGRATDDGAEQRIVDAYLKDRTQSMPVIAKRFGYSTMLVKNALARRDLVPRRKTYRYQLNEAFFDDALTNPVSASIVGLWMTDGCVMRRPGGMLSLSLAGDDGKYVEQVRDLIGTDRPVKVDSRERRVGKYFRRPTTSLHVASDRLATALGKYGVVPRKTYSAEFHSGLEHSAAAWSGCIDGDGWIIYRIAPNKRDRLIPVVGLCGAAQLLNQFASFVRPIVATNAKVRQAAPNVWNFVLVGWAAVQVIRVLVASTPIGLPRKRATAADILADFSSIPSDGKRCLPAGMIQTLTANRLAARIESLRSSVSLS